MRSDMFEVIIERPRHGSRWAYAQKGRRREKTTGPEMSLKREPMSLGRGVKSLNENLAPLRRFLQSRVSRPWNEVRAEICEHLSMNSAVQKHVLDHLNDYVEEHPVFIEGVPCMPDGRGARRDEYFRIGEYRRWVGFYVCPRTGLLKRAPSAPKRRRPRQDPSIKRIDDQREARRIDGIWYMVTLAPVPADKDAIASCYDVVLKLWLTPQMASRYGLLRDTYGDHEKYAVAKRQMSKREILARIGK